ncbi:MAG TPA: DUF4249 family protein [Bacteroidia bacterium]|nr:DUF4249 family protein [Bacteroidia bacterium]
MKQLVYIIFAIITLASCQEKVDIDLGFAGEKLVVEGYVSNETDSSFVKLHLTAPYLGNEPSPAITNAVVEVTEDNNPAVIFTHVGDGLYKPAPGYKGIADKTYKLKVVYDGKEYTSESKLEPMFEVDPVLQQEFRPADGFIEEGFAITYLSRDSRDPVKYTWFNFGKNDTLENFDVLFDSENTVLNQWLPFELPFFRAQKGDSVMMIFRSIDAGTSSYITALNSLSNGAPGPFQTPPANPPTNIKGGAVGLFYAADVVRRWRIVN